MIKMLLDLTWCYIKVYNFGNNFYVFGNYHKWKPRNVGCFKTLSLPWLYHHESTSTLNPRCLVGASQPTASCTAAGPGKVPLLIHIFTSKLNILHPNLPWLETFYIAITLNWLKNWYFQFELGPGQVMMRVSSSVRTLSPSNIQQVAT